MVFPFNNPPQFNVQKQLNKNIIIINWISFNNGPGAEKKEKRYKVVALSSQHFDDDCWLYQNPPVITVPLSTPPHMMSVILSWSS